MQGEDMRFPRIFGILECRINFLDPAQSEQFGKRLRLDLIVNQIASLVDYQKRIVSGQGGMIDSSNINDGALPPAQFEKLIAETGHEISSTKFGGTTHAHASCVPTIDVFRDDAFGCWQFSHA